MTAFKMIQDGSDHVQDEPVVPDCALIARYDGKCALLYWHGTGLDYWIDGTGAYDTANDIGQDAGEAIEREGDGIFVWTGRIRAWDSHTENGYEHDEELEGDLRSVSREEWEHFCQHGDLPLHVGERQLHALWQMNRAMNRALQHRVDVEERLQQARDLLAAFVNMETVIRPAGPICAGLIDQARKLLGLPA